MPIANSVTKNRLLAAIPSADRDRLASHLTSVTLAQGDVLYEPRSVQTLVYFPTSAIISLLYVLANGSSAEFAMVGNEGFVGVALCMLGTTMRGRAVVLGSGHALRAEAKFVREEFLRTGALHQLFLRYMQVRLVQTLQTDACCRHHSVDQQLCRWLLMCRDRSPRNELAMTQAVIASMLGVRREGITVAASKLQEAGAIDYSRGRIRVLDRRRLKGMACECHDVIRKESARILAGG